MSAIRMYTDCEQRHRDKSLGEAIRYLMGLKACADTATGVRFSGALLQYFLSEYCDDGSVWMPIGIDVTHRYVVTPRAEIYDLGVAA